MTAPQTIPVSEIDLFSDEVLADPYPRYRELRELGSLVLMTAEGFYALPRYAEVRAALNDWETFSSDRGVGFNDQVNEQLVGTILGSDPPQQTVLRRVLADRLAPRALRQLKADLLERARGHVEKVLAGGVFDAHGELAQDYVANVIIDLVGFPQDQRERLPDFGVAAFDSMGPLNERAVNALGTFEAMFNDYLVHVATRERLAPGSMGIAVYEAVDRGELPAENAIPLLAAYVGAGMDTTITAITSGVVLFAEHPEQWAKVREDPSLVSAAFNEVLRYDAPVHLFARRTTREVEIDGEVVPEGASVAMIFASANHDERKFPDPERFDVSRNPVDHLSFGYGIHSCAGQGLARIEFEAVFQALAEQVDGFSVEAVERRLNNTARLFGKVSVTAS